MLEVLLAAAPLFLLVALLLFGIYPGYEAIVRLSERIAARQSVRISAAARSPLPVPRRRFAPSGGLLIALGHAQRPPPIAS